MKIFTCNIAGRRKVTELVAVIQQDQPDVIVITEGYHAHRWLRRLAKRHGYTALLSGRKYGSEGPDVPMLVRNQIAVERWHRLVMTEEWRGPLAGKAHDPRVYPVAVLAAPNDPTPWVVVGMHAPTHNCPAAQAETEAAMVTLAKRHPNARIVIAGDFNKRSNELNALAVRIDGQVFIGTLVDHVIGRGVTCTHTFRRVHQPGGTHGWNLYRLVRKD